jgi:hypothetical protein
MSNGVVVTMHYSHVPASCDTTSEQRRSNTGSRAQEKREFELDCSERRLRPRLTHQGGTVMCASECK